jgi:outer membrane protein
VDMQEVLNKSQKGLAVKQRLDGERGARQKDLDAKQQEVIKLQAEFEKQAPLLSEQAKREKSEAIQRKTRDAVRIAEDANRDFDKRVREAELDITREILGVVQEYGKDQGFSLILERSMVVFGASTVDITSEIIKRYDAKQK